MIGELAWVPWILILLNQRAHARMQVPVNLLGSLRLRQEAEELSVFEFQVLDSLLH